LGSFEPRVALSPTERAEVKAVRGTIKVKRFWMGLVEPTRVRSFLKLIARSYPKQVGRGGSDGEQRVVLVPLKPGRSAAMQTEAESILARRSRTCELQGNHSKGFRDPLRRSKRSVKL
jgi:hypothetical protein